MIKDESILEVILLYKRFFTTAKSQGFTDLQAFELCKNVDIPNLLKYLGPKV